MTAEFLEDFLLMTPDQQEACIFLQRQKDELEAKRLQYEAASEALRAGQDVARFRRQTLRYRLTWRLVTWLAEHLPAERG